MAAAGAEVLDDALKAEFREGFYPDRPAGWIEHIARPSDTDEVQADIPGMLAALAAGQRDFAYPRHDAQVYDLLEQIIPRYGIKRGADVGCATGSFPAMQLANGVEECTVFEVRQIEAKDDRVKVRIEDLTYAEDVQPEFDLITCLSTIEHIGLGRYGDPIDPWGDVKMATNLRRLLRPGGILLISFPVGRGTVVFNMHRIYSEHRRRQLFGDLKLVAYARGRSRLGDLRYRWRLLRGVPGAQTQPIYALQRA